MTAKPKEKAIRALAAGARDQTPVAGGTHNFYRYPARFSPAFVAAAIDCFSRPSDMVLDPYMGGGTTVVESMLAGRHAVGGDLNSLAVFVTRVKTSLLTGPEHNALTEWAEVTVPTFSYTETSARIASLLQDRRNYNLHCNRGRYLKKIIAVALTSVGSLPTRKSQDFARCAVLRAGQIVLDGRTRNTTVAEFRELLATVVEAMLDGVAEFAERAETRQRTLIEGCATALPKNPVFSEKGQLADLVITSPPYPGVHVLYHRWQIDGRRESPAPYWIAGCDDGQAGSYYTFGDRKAAGLRTYFENSLRSLGAIRRVMRDGAYIVQMIAFSDPHHHLPRYLRNMERAGFEEEAILGKTRSGAIKRIWRNVPGRRWHAQMQGATASSREVVLVHRAS